MGGIMTKKDVQVTEKVEGSKWESGDRLIGYNRVSPLARWSKRLFWLLLLFALPILLCFLSWWTRLPEAQRQHWIATHPELQKVDGWIPKDWHRGNDPVEAPKPEEQIVQASPNRAKPRAKSSPTPIKDSSNKTIAPKVATPDELPPEPPGIHEQVTVLADLTEQKVSNPQDGVMTMTVAEFDQWKRRMEQTNEERKKQAQAYLENGGLLISWKAWAKRQPLTWDDFRNPSLDTKNNWAGYISTGISMSRGRLTHHAFAYMVPEVTWNRLGSNSEASLRHAQAHFDITELYARKLRSRLAAQRPVGNRDANRMYRETIEEHNIMQADFDQQTVHGSLLDAEERWKKDIEVAMAKFADLEWIPDWKNTANADHSDAQFYLAQAYANGTDGVPQSEKLAKSWYARAIRNGAPGRSPALRRPARPRLRRHRRRSRADRPRTGTAAAPVRWARWR